MKKYVKASEQDITQIDIHEVASDILYDELDNFRRNWYNQFASSGWNVFEDKLGLDVDFVDKNDTTYYQLLKNTYPDILDKIIDEVDNLVHKLDSDLY